MDIADGNAAASANAGRALSGLGDFFTKLGQLHKENAFRQQELGIKQAAETRAQQLWDTSGKRIAQNEADVSDATSEWAKQQARYKTQLFRGGSPDAQTGPGAPLFSPRDLQLFPDVTPPSVPAPSAPQASGGPDMSSISRGLPSVLPAVTAPGVSGPAPTPKVGVAASMGKDGNIEFGPGAISPDLKTRFDADPSGTYAATADPLTRTALEGYAKANGVALGNRKSAADTEQALMTSAYGNPDERKSHSEFARNSAQLSHRLDEYDDTVSKYGNYEWFNPDGAAKLSSLPLDISDNWTKVTNPGGVLREGLVHLGKDLQIPTANDHWYGALGVGPRNDTTRAAIKQTKNVLADYVRQYENLPYTKVPVMGLTPELRKLVGDTAASAAYQKEFKRPVPTESPTVQKLPNVSPGSQAAAPTSATASPAVAVTSQADYDKLPAGASYVDSSGVPKTKAGSSTPRVRATRLPSVYPITTPQTPRGLRDATP